MDRNEIPRFFLYGEPPRDVGDRFLHLEELDDRSRPANWNIRPHSHAALHHVFHLTAGGGEMRADDATLVYEAPCLILVPAGTVHGFSWAENSCGQVLTLSLSYFQDLARRDRELARVFTPPAVLALRDGGLVPQTLVRLAEELSWTAPGHGVAVEGLLLTLLVQALRLRHDATEAGPRPVGPQAALMARFRELVEARYRTHMLVDDYAAELGVHPRRLRAACLSLAGASPVQLVQERRLLEAKRLLLYSNMTVAETAYYLGFQDPAYFTRVFTKVCNVSPRTYRRELQAPSMVLDLGLKVKAVRGTAMARRGGSGAR